MQEIETEPSMSRNRGASMLEYGLMLALIAVISVGVVVLFGQAVLALYLAAAAGL